MTLIIIKGLLELLKLLLLFLLVLLNIDYYN